MTDEKKSTNETSYDVCTPGECSSEDNVSGHILALSSNGSIFVGIFNLANAALGAGLLSFPKAFAIVGIPFALALQVISVSSQFCGTMVLGYAAKLTASDSMALITHRLLGRRWAQGAVFTLVFFSFTINIYYLQVIRVQAGVLAKYWDPLHNETAFADLATVIVGVVFIYPMSCWRNISALGFVSFLALVGCIYVAFYVCVQSGLGHYPEGAIINDADEKCPSGEGRSKVEPDFEIFSIFDAIPNICFGYASLATSVPTYADLSPKAQDKYHYVALSGSLIVVVVYTMVGITGAMTFGGCAIDNSIILANYRSTDVGANIGRVCVSIAVAISYPIIAFTGRQELAILWESLVMKYQWTFSSRGAFILNTPNRRLFLIGFVWFFTTLGLALGIKEVGYVVDLVGLACAMTMFLFPGAIAMKLANLSYAETVDAAMSCLPDGVSEKSPHSWAYGARGRVTRWLGRTEWRAMRWSGCMLVTLSTILLVMCPITYVKTNIL